MPSEQPGSRRVGRGLRLGLLAAGLAVAVVVGLAFASTFWTDTERLAEGALEEQLDGPFYSLPSPAPAGTPGTLVRSEQIPGAPDGAVAWRVLYQTGAGADLVVWGHSQGGQAALFAAQSAEEYAPELTLRAAAVAAPATDLVALLKADITDISGVTIGSYAFSAYAEVYGPSTSGATLDTILTPAAAEVVDEMSELCLLRQNSELHDIGSPLIGEFLAADPATAEPWASLLATNTPGASSDPGPLAVPVFVAQGLADPLVRPDITADWVDRQRARGTVVTYETLDGTDHGLAALRAVPALMSWLGAHGLPS